MRNNKNNDEEQQEGQAEWMATYSDMVTLLFTFFVLLFAISNVDAQKFALLAAGLSKTGITAEQFLEIQDKYGMDGKDIPDPNDIQFPGPDDTKNPTPTPTISPTSDPDGEGPGGELGTLHAQILDYITQNELEDSMQLIFQGDRLLLTLTNDAWFASGSAEITANMYEKAVALAHLLRDTQNPEMPFDIITVGHTDNQPINTGRYPSNWYLSVDRSVKFLEVLINESKLPSRNFSARGCGEEEPIGDNETAEGRQVNRRVEVLISQPKTQAQ